jgi:hypothetical protein
MRSHGEAGSGRVWPGSRRACGREAEPDDRLPDTSLCVPDTPRLESIEVRLTFPRFLGAVLLTLVFLVLGFFLVLASYDTWLLQEMVLRRRLVVPRLLTFAANPTEFVLRCLSWPALGLSFFPLGLFFWPRWFSAFGSSGPGFSRKRSSPACRCGSICSLSRALCSGLPCCLSCQLSTAERINRSLASWK